MDVIKGLTFGVILVMTITISSLYCMAESKGGEGYRFGANAIVAQDEIIPGDLTSGGAVVEMAGKVQGHLIAFGAHMVVSGIVQGDLECYGANVILSGSFQGKAKSICANLTITGIFEGDLEVIAAKVRITPTAVIKGDLIYSAEIMDLSLIHI